MKQVEIRIWNTDDKSLVEVYMNGEFWFDKWTNDLFSVMNFIGSTRNLAGLSLTILFIDLFCMFRIRWSILLILIIFTGNLDWKNGKTMNACWKILNGEKIIWNTAKRERH